MQDSQQNNDCRPKRAPCRAAMIVGIIGFVIILWPYLHAIEAIFKMDLKGITFFILWSVMIAGLWIAIWKGREGIGGMMIVLSGSGVFIFLLLLEILRQGDGGGKIVGIVATLPLFLSGILYYICWRRRKARYNQ